MKRLWLCVILALSVAGLAVVSGVEAEPPEKGLWWYYPVAHGTPEEPVPSNAELLKVVPPLRKVPAFSKADKELGLATWWGDYSQLIYSEQPPSKADLSRKPVISTPAGEDEPLVLGLWGITRSGAVTLGVTKSPFPVTIRQIVFDPRRLPTPYRDVNVPGGRVVGFSTYMPESGTGTVKPGENTVFWINVEVPKGTKPGNYDITLNLIVHQVKEIPITATVKVLPFDLPAADIAYGMYFRWAGPQNDARYRTPELMRKYWQDMARHGMTSYTLYQYTASGTFIDAQGNVKPLDGHEDIQVLQQMKDIGLIHPDIPIMILSSNLAEYPEAAKTVAQEMKKRGFPELLVYGRDEPPVDDATKAQFEAMKPVRKYMRTTTAITDHAAAAYADLIDVWTLNGGRVTPDIRKLAAEKNKELWTYDCNHRGRGNSARARFYSGLYTWALKLKGNFHWCYTEGYTWEGDRNATFCFVLPSDSGPVPSPAWEARREGIEDYRTLHLLEARIAAHPGSATAREASQWLAKLRSRVDWNLIKGMPKSVYPWDNAEVFPMCPDFDPAEFPGIRAKAQEFVVKLGE